MNPHLKNARQFAKLMDSQFHFLGFRFGLENIVGLVPGIGDTLSLILSSYLLWIGVQMKLPTDKLATMIFNLMLDFFIGSVPVIGDIGDLFFKANLKNLKILEEHDRAAVIEGEIIPE